MKHLTTWIVFLLLAVSCISNKRITYLQNLPENEPIQLDQFIPFAEVEYRYILQPFDIVDIDFASSDEELTKAFEFQGSRSMRGGGAGGGGGAGAGLGWGLGAGTGATGVGAGFCTGGAGAGGAAAGGLPADTTLGLAESPPPPPQPASPAMAALTNARLDICSLTCASFPSTGDISALLINLHHQHIKLLR